MTDRYFLDVDSVIIFTGSSVRVAHEINPIADEDPEEEVDREEEKESKPKRGRKKGRTARKIRVCGSCGKPGHNAKTCANKGKIYRPSDDLSDLKSVDDIKRGMAPSDSED